MKQIFTAIFSLTLFLFSFGLAGAESSKAPATHEAASSQTVVAVCRVTATDRTGAVTWLELTAAEFQARGCPEGSTAFIKLETQPEFLNPIESISGEPSPKPFDRDQP